MTPAPLPPLTASPEAPDADDGFASDDASPFAVDAPFTPLDPRTVRVWRLDSLLSSAILLGLGGGGVAFVYFVSEGSPTALLWAGGVWLAFALLRAWLFFGWLPRNYAAWGYRVDERVLEIRSGVWWKNLSLLPLSRLQHVDIQRGPFERKYGLATLRLYTAGTLHAMLTLPGLDADEAVRLRDRLLAASGGDDAV